MTDKEFLAQLKETFGYTLMAYKSETKRYRSKDDVTELDFKTYQDLSKLHIYDGGEFT